MLLARRQRWRPTANTVGDHELIACALRDTTRGDLHIPAGMTVMAVMLQHFDVQRVGTADGQPPRELLQLAMGPVGLRMQLRERSGSNSPQR
jgi:hypothetical protein